MAVDWGKTEDLFHEAAVRPQAERRRWLREACAGDAELETAVLEMLDADAAGDGDIVDSVRQAAGRWLTSHDLMVDRAGPWRVLRLLGQGGMGAVYLVTRDDESFEKLAALKVLHIGMANEATRSRFMLERQILAELDHPHIARLLDGGSLPDGQPYLVMEYVDGKPLVEYCRSRSLQERCGLFALVCDAVASAHQRLIVHRDLKPVNILVDAAGTPKLLDFGIAKLLGAEPDTAAHTLTQAMFTADYASPEQLQGKPITTAADVYALGAILYELVCGEPLHRPRDRSFADLVKSVCEEEPEPPSRRSRERVPQDLDRIVLRAMAREPGRRYRTAFEMAEDLRRLIDNRPVMARRDSWMYVAGKFARRHVVPVMVIAALAMALVGTTVWSIHERVRANERSARLRSLTGDLLFKVQGSLDGVVGATKARKMLVSTALEHFEALARESHGDVELRHDLAVAYRRIGDVQGYPRNPNLGDLAGAVGSYQRGLLLMDGRPTDPDRRLQRATILSHLADSLFALGRMNEAKARYEEALGSATQDEGTTAQRVAQAAFLADTYQARIGLWSALGDSTRATMDAEKSRQSLDRGLKASPDDVRLLSLGVTIRVVDARGLMFAGKYTEAQEVSDRSIAEGEAVLARTGAEREVHRLMTAYQTRCDLLGNQAKPQEALAACRQGTRLADRLLAADPANPRSKYEVSLMVVREARLLNELGRPVEALAEAQRSVRLTGESLAVQPDSSWVQAQHGSNLFRLGNTYSRLGSKSEALEMFGRAAKILEPLLSQRVTVGEPLLNSLEEAGDLLVSMGRTSAGADMYRKALHICERYAGSVGLPRQGYAEALRRKLAGANR